MSKFMLRFKRDQKGATAIEYGLIAALMSVIVIAAVTAIGTPLKTTFENIGTTLTTRSSASNTPAPAPTPAPQG